MRNVQETGGESKVIRMTRGEKVCSKWVETRKDPNKPWYESSGLNPREGCTQSKSRTKCAKRCGWSSGCFGPHPRQRSLQRVLLANASFADLTGWRNSDTISFYMVDLRKKRKIWRLLKIVAVFVTRVKCLQQHTWRKISRTRSSERRIGAMLVLESNVEDVQCSLERWLHSCHFRCQSKRP